MNYDKSCSIIVSSCDAYQDAWKPFFTLFFKYWPDCPFPVYLISNNLKYDDERVIPVNVKDDKKWAGNLKEAIDTISSPYVIYLQEDYFLQKHVDIERIISLIKYIKDSADVGYLRLFPSPGPDKDFPNDLNLGEISAGAPYRNSTQAAIWDVQVLRQFLVDGETGWDFEKKGTARSRNIKKRFLSAREPVINYPKATGIKKGGWTYDAIVLFKKEGLDIDLTKRPVRSRFTVCFFGIYDPEYSRNRVLIKGLRANGVEVIECNSRLSGIKKYFDLIKKHQKVKNKYDFLLVAFPGYQTAILARFLTHKPIIFDAFFSIFNQATEDRKTLKKFSIRANYYWLLDWLACTLANKILLDTNIHIEYFVKNFSIKKDKFIRVFVGTDPELFYPRESKKSEKFMVHFHGHFIPLQGTEYIIRAANILKNEDVIFQIIGSGQEYNRVRKLADDLGLENITWIPKVSYNQLPDYISRSDICLGIFGDTAKAQLVIPNKIYEAIAVRKPTISGETPAIKELFTDRENIMLCHTADPSNLADKILELKKNPELGQDIAQKGYELFKSNATPQKITVDLINKLIKQ